MIETAILIGVFTLVFSIGVMVGRGTKQDIDLSKLKIPYTDVSGIARRLDKLNSLLEKTKKPETFYDAGEQLNIIVKILSRAFPPREESGVDDKK